MNVRGIKTKLASAGLHLAVEKDATGGGGYEYSVTEGSKQIAAGWSAGNATDAAHEALVSVRKLGKVAS